MPYNNRTRYSGFSFSMLMISIETITMLTLTTSRTITIMVTTITSGMIILTEETITMESIKNGEIETWVPPGEKDSYT